MDNHHNTKKTKRQEDITASKSRWAMKKKGSLKVSGTLDRLGHEKKSLRMKDCSSYMLFEQSLQTGARRLSVANFCRIRLCPMCEWRKSLKAFRQVSETMDVALYRNKNLVPLFLSLTVKNATGDKLPDALTQMTKAWNKLKAHQKFKRVVKGWFRAIEITYNKKADTYHPHLHAIILVDQSYFEGKDYIHTTEWVRRWKLALGVDYNPICDIRKVKMSDGDDRYKSIAEISKYAVKDADYIFPSKKMMDKVVGVLSVALHNRRLFALGGLLKTIAVELKNEDVGKGDLADPKMRGDVATVLELYRWNYGLGRYKKECGDG
jgi:plasmid rolling circle replication initiator protein Rep